MGGFEFGDVERCGLGGWGVDEVAGVENDLRALWGDTQGEGDNTGQSPVFVSLSSRGVL